MIAAWVLGLLLVVAIPGRALWNSRSAKPPRSRTRRYIGTIAEISGLLLGLAVVAFLNGAAPADFAGFGWEILYLGLLLWWLAPLVGIVGAVLIASVAYGLGHGWKSHSAGLGSIVSAFLFTVGYALTGSLRWLIAIHTAIPLVGLLAGWRTRTRQAEVQHA